jgi:hypothetical protein
VADTLTPEEFITLCAWTKRVRVGDRWCSIEDYLLQFHGLTVTHGICPEVMAEILRKPSSSESRMASGPNLKTSKPS